MKPFRKPSPRGILGKVRLQPRVKNDMTKAAKTPQRARKTAKKTHFYKVKILKHMNKKLFHLSRLLTSQFIALLLLTTPALAVEETEVFGFAQELKSLRAVELVDLVKEKRLGGEQKKPVMLFIYASWCPHCRDAMETLHGMNSAFFKDIQPVYLSVDRDFIKLSRYLLENKYTNFEPYVLKAAGLATPMEILTSRLGTNWRGGIPYFAFIDAEGRIRNEAFGNVPEETLATYLRDLN